MTRRLGLGLRQKSPLVCADILWPALVVVWRASADLCSHFATPLAEKSVPLYIHDHLVSAVGSQKVSLSTRPLCCFRHLSPNLAITIFASFAVSVHTSIPKQLPPSPLPLFTPSLTWKSEGVMVDESGELIEPTEEVPLKKLGESQLERLVCGWRREAGSWFQRRGEAYGKERSVIRR